MRTKRTAAGSAATSTASQRSNKSMKAQSLALLESLRNGTQNPFERVDPQLLEAAHRLHSKPNKLEDIEDALL
jgi:hypothetical protein